MKVFRVFKQVEFSGDSPGFLGVGKDHVGAAGDPPVWLEVGEIESDYSYVHPDAETIGKRFGAGTFLTVFSRSSDEKTVVSRLSYHLADVAEATNVDAKAQS